MRPLARDLLLVRQLAASACGAGGGGAPAPRPSAAQRWPSNEITCWIPLGPVRVAHRRRQQAGRELIRSRIASERHGAGSAVPCSAAISAPAAAIAAQIAFWQRLQLAVAAVGVPNGLLDLHPEQRRGCRGRSTGTSRRTGRSGGRLKRENSESSSSSCGAEPRRHERVGDLGPGAVHDRGAGVVDLAVEVAVEAAAAVVAPGDQQVEHLLRLRRSGACEPLSSFFSSGTVSIARTSWVAAGVHRRGHRGQRPLALLGREPGEVLVEQVDAADRAVAAPLVVGGAEALGGAVWFQLVIVPSAGSTPCGWPCLGEEALPLVLAGAERRQARIDASGRGSAAGRWCTRRCACCRCRTS